MPDPVRFSISIEDPISPGGAPPDSSTEVPFLVLEPGQIVRGRLAADVLEPVDFRELQVRFVWHTEGRGNEARGEGGTEVLLKDGRWDAGAAYEFPFQISAPWGPLG